MRFSTGIVAAIVGAAAFASAPAAFAQVVIPTGAAAVEGVGSLGRPLDATPQTTQFFYGTTALTGLTIGDQITGMQYRLDGGNPTGPGADLTFADYEITLSTSSLTPATASATFASNIGANALLVRDGALNIAANSFPGGPGPNPFGPVITFSSVYTYTGGPMVVTVRHSGSGTTGLSVDAINTGDTANIFNDGQNATSGSVITSAPVLRLTVLSGAAAAPEPASLALVGLMGGIAGVLRGRKRAK
jgi:hypothetical protein